MLAVDGSSLHYALLANVFQEIHGSVIKEKGEQQCFGTFSGTCRKRKETAEISLECNFKRLEATEIINFMMPQ